MQIKPWIPAFAGMTRLNPSYLTLILILDVLFDSFISLTLLSGSTFISKSRFLPLLNSSKLKIYSTRSFGKRETCLPELNCLRLLVGRSDSNSQEPDLLVPAFSDDESNRGSVIIVYIVPPCKGFRSLVVSTSLQCDNSQIRLAILVFRGRYKCGNNP